MLQHSITVGAAADAEPSFTTVVDGILQLGCCNKARISIQPPDKVTVMVYGGQAAAEFAQHNQDMGQSDPNSNLIWPSGFIWGIKVQLRPGEGLSQLSQTPSLLLKCNQCKGSSRVCNNAADAISFLNQHGSHDAGWTQALKQQHQLQQYLDRLFKQHRKQQKQHPEVVLPIQRTTALICVEVAYLLLRTPELRSSKWLETLAQTILFHRVMWYMTSCFRPSVAQLQQQDPSQHQRSPHLLWLLIGAPPYCQSALAINQDVKHWSLEASCLVALLHRSDLLPRANRKNQAPTEQQVLAALQQLVLRFEGASADAAAAARSSAAEAPDSQGQQAPDRAFIVGLLQLRGLQLRDIVRAAGPEGVDTQVDLCAICGEDYEPPHEQLTECKVCCHSYHNSCATDPHLSGVAYTAAAVAAAKRGTCLGCQGFPLNAVSAAAAGEASSSRPPRKMLPWGAAEASTAVRVLEPAQASPPPAATAAAAVAAGSKGHKALGSPSKGRNEAAVAAAAGGGDAAGTGGKLAATGLHQRTAVSESSSPRFRRPSCSPIAEAAAAGSKWPCQPTPAAADAAAADVAQKAREYKQYTVTALSSKGISAQSMNAGVLLHQALLPPGLELDVSAGAAQQPRARFTVVAAAARSQQRQQLQCSVCKTLFATLAAADEHAYGGKPSNKASENMRLVGTGGMALRDFLQWIKDSEAEEQQEPQHPEVSVSEATQGAAQALQLLSTAGAAAVQSRHQRQQQQQAAVAMPAPRRVTAPDVHLQVACPSPQLTGQSAAAILEGLGQESTSRAPTAADFGGAGGDAAELATPPSPTGGGAGGPGGVPQSEAAAGAVPGPPAVLSGAVAAADATGVLPVHTLPAGLRVGTHQQQQRGLADRNAAGVAAAAAASARGQKRTREQDVQQQQQHRQRLRQDVQQPQLHMGQQQPQQHEQQLPQGIQQPEQQQEQQQPQLEREQQQQEQQPARDIQRPEHQRQRQQQQHRDGSSDASVTSTGPTTTTAAGDLTTADDEVRPSKRHRAAAPAPQQEQPGQQGVGQAAQQGGAEQEPAAQLVASNTQSSSGLQPQQQQQQQRKQNHRPKKRRASSPPNLSSADKAALMHTVGLRWQLFRVPDVAMRYHLEQLLQPPEGVSQQLIEQFVSFWVPPAAEACAAEAGSSSAAAAAAVGGGGGGDWDWEGVQERDVPRAVLVLMKLAARSAVPAQQLDGLLQVCYKAAKVAYRAQSTPVPGAAGSAAAQEQQSGREAGPDQSRRLVAAMLKLACKLLSCSNSVSSFWKIADAVLTAAMSVVSGTVDASSTSRGDQGDLVHEKLRARESLCGVLWHLSDALNEQTWHDIWRLIRRDVRAVNSQQQQEQPVGQQPQDGSAASCSQSGWLEPLGCLLAITMQAPAAWQQLLGSTCGSQLQQQGTPEGAIPSPAAAAAAALNVGLRQEKLLKVLFRVVSQCIQLTQVIPARTPDQVLDSTMQRDEQLQLIAGLKERLISQKRLIPAFHSAMSAASACVVAAAGQHQHVQEGSQQTQLQQTSVVQHLFAHLLLLMDFQLQALLLSEAQLGKLLALFSRGVGGLLVDQSAKHFDQIRVVLESIRTGCSAVGSTGAALTPAEVLGCIGNTRCKCRGHLAAADCEYLAASIELTLASLRV